MALETGTFINDLVATNPPGSDLKSQGDDHLRLIKSILRLTFPRAAKAFRFPQNVSKSADYTVLSTDDNSHFTIDTTGGVVNITLPTLAASDDGWNIHLVKSNTGTNPFYIIPPSGTINGFSKVRRTMEFLITRVVWNGSIFVASRPNGGSIGELRAFFGATLPNDCLWPDGSTFTAANYVELNSTLGGNVLPDCRGRVVAGRDDMNGVNAARIGTLATDSGTITGTSRGSAGGSATHVQTTSEMPTHNHSVTDPTHFHTVNGPFTNAQSLSSGGNSGPDASVGTNKNTDAKSTGISIQNNGSSSAMAWLQPTIIGNFGVVVE